MCENDKNLRKWFYDKIKKKLTSCEKQHFKLFFNYNTNSDKFFSMQFHIYFVTEVMFFMNLITTVCHRKGDFPKATNALTFLKNLNFNFFSIFLH